jgi:hypothetical protein
MRIYHGKVVFINHHGNRMLFRKGIDKVITISSDIFDKLAQEKQAVNAVNIQWGGAEEF